MNGVKVTEESARMAVRLARFEAFGEAIAIAERFISPPDDGSDLKAEIASETAHHIAAEITELRIAAKPRTMSTGRDSDGRYPSQDYWRVRALGAEASTYELNSRVAELKGAIGRAMQSGADAGILGAEAFAILQGVTHDGIPVPRRERAKPTEPQVKRGE